MLFELLIVTFSQYLEKAGPLNDVKNSVRKHR